MSGFTILLLEEISRRISTSNLDQFLQRNKEFAVQQSAAGTLMPSLPRAMPKVKAVIIGCADMRVDPAHVLGIKPGEAVGKARRASLASGRAIPALPR
jgi:hypothetical protein